MFLTKDSVVYVVEPDEQGNRNSAKEMTALSLFESKTSLRLQGWSLLDEKGKVFKAFETEQAAFEHLKSVFEFKNSMDRDFVEYVPTKEDADFLLSAYKQVYSGAHKEKEDSKFTKEMLALEDSKIYVVQTDENFNRTEVAEVNSLDFYQQHAGMTKEGNVVLGRNGEVLKEFENEANALSLIKKTAEFNLYHSEFSPEYFHSEEAARYCLEGYLERQTGEPSIFIQGKDRSNNLALKESVLYVLQKNSSLERFSHIEKINALNFFERFAGVKVKDNSLIGRNSEVIGTYESEDAAIGVVASEAKRKLQYSQGGRLYFQSREEAEDVFIQAKAQEVKDAEVEADRESKALIKAPNFLSKLKSAFSYG